METAETMRLNFLLKYLLKEVNLKPEAPKDAPLGQYLFAPERSDTPTPKEPNTELEDMLLANLGSHYSGGSDADSVEYGVLKLLDLKNKGWYQKLLKPPSGLAYRFISGLSPKEASTLFLNNLPTKDVTAEPNKAFYVSNIGIIERPSIVSTVRTEKTLVSSWTIKPTAPNFDDFIFCGNKSVIVLLVADIESNNFIMNPKNLVKAKLNVSRLDRIENEQEVIAIGPVNVLEAAVTYKDGGAPYYTRDIHKDLLRALNLKMKKKKVFSPGK